MGILEIRERFEYSDEIVRSNLRKMLILRVLGSNSFESNWRFFYSADLLYVSLLLSQVAEKFVLHSNIEY